MMDRSMFIRILPGLLEIPCSLHITFMENCPDPGQCLLAEWMDWQRNISSTFAEKVERVLSVSKEVLLEGDKKEPYDKILIATGASAFVPPIPGIHQENVFAMRTIQDADQLKPVLEEGKIKSAAVIGASMVGIKLIELLTARGIHCTLVDMAFYIFPVSAVPSVADEIQNRLIKKGVDMAFSKALTQIEEKDGKLQVVFKEGEPLTCDAVMMCIGTRANTQVADADLKVNRGIVVDMGMRTNMPDIYSAGDCCEGRNIQSGVNQIIGIWDNAARQGETAGINMAGGNIEYEGNILHNITHFMGMDFIGFGDVRAEGKNIPSKMKRMTGCLWCA